MSNVVNRGLDAVRCPGKDRLSSHMGTFEEDVLLVSDHLMLCSDPSRKSRKRPKSGKMPNILLIEEKCFDYAWLDSGLISIKENCIEKQARKFFDGKNGMRLVLLGTLEKLHYFEVEVERIWKLILQQMTTKYDAAAQIAQVADQVHNSMAGAQGAADFEASRARLGEGAFREGLCDTEGVIDQAPASAELSKGVDNVSSSPASSFADPLAHMSGPMTRLRSKRMKEALNGLIQDVQAQEDSRVGFYKPKMVTILHVAQLEDPS